VTSKTAKPGKKSNSVKDQKKLTAKTSGGGPKKGEPTHAGGVIVNPSEFKRSTGGIHINPSKVKPIKE
jgi:hypothetical protein